VIFGNSAPMRDTTSAHVHVSSAFVLQCYFECKGYWACVIIVTGIWKRIRYVGRKIHGSVYNASQGKSKQPIAFVLLYASAFGNRARNPRPFCPWTVYSETSLNAPLMMFWT
jgi:hypothetical protein